MISLGKSEYATDDCTVYSDEINIHLRELALKIGTATLQLPQQGRSLSLITHYPKGPPGAQGPQQWELHIMTQHPGSVRCNGDLAKRHANSSYILRETV